MNPMFGVLIRYAISAIGTFLATRGVLEPDKISTLTEQLGVIAGALMMVVPIIFGMWREPSAKASEVAKAVDLGTVKIVQTPPGVPNKVEGTVPETVKSI